MEEQEAQENEILQAARKQKLLGLLEEKRDDSLREMSAEGLQELIDDL